MIYNQPWSSISTRHPQNMFRLRMKLLQQEKNIPCRSNKIDRSANKRLITGTFTISLHGEFLPMQLIYGGTTTPCLSKFEFSSGFYTEKSLKFLEEVIKPDVKKQRQTYVSSVCQLIRQSSTNHLIWWSMVMLSDFSNVNLMNGTQDKWKVNWMM